MQKDRACKCFFIFIKFPKVSSCFYSSLSWLYCQYLVVLEYFTFVGLGLNLSLIRFTFTTSTGYKYWQTLWKYWHVGCILRQVKTLKTLGLEVHKYYCTFCHLLWSFSQFFRIFHMDKKLYVYKKTQHYINFKFIEQETSLMHAFSHIHVQSSLTFTLMINKFIYHNQSSCSLSSLVQYDKCFTEDYINTDRGNKCIRVYLQ